MLIYCIFVSTYFFIRTYHNYSYGYLPKPKEIEKDIKDFKEYYKTIIVNGDKISNKVEEDMRNYITTWYIESSEKNTTNNDMKSYFRHMTYKWFIGILVFLILSSFMFFLNNLLK